MYRDKYKNEELTSDIVKNVILSLGLHLIIAIVVVTISTCFSSVAKFIDENSWKLIGFSFVLPLTLSVFVNKIHINLNRVIALLYTVFTGLLMTYAAFKYGIPKFLLAIFISVIIFSVMSYFGNNTKEDLERYRVILKINLFFLIVMMLVNLYFGVHILYWIIDYSIIGNFTAFIAFDINHIKQEVSLANKNEKLLKRIELSGMLQFYFDFMILSVALMDILTRK